jgi:PTS system ascorbate-specific IIC component
MNALLISFGFKFIPITTAEKPISEKNNSRCSGRFRLPYYFPSAPTAVFIGFVTNLIGGILAMLTMIALHFPVIILPAIRICEDAK